MATYENDIQFEESKGSQAVIRLIKSGIYFHAYDHSAWLFSKKIAEYKVLRHYLKKSKREILFVGFKAENLFGTLGDHQAIKTERGFDVPLSPEDVPPAEGYDTWRASVPTEKVSKSNFLSVPMSGTEAEREAIRQLREFPIESKSMLECVAFLVELRKLLNQK